MNSDEAYRSFAKGIVSRNFPASGPELVVGGIPISEIVGAHGTPVYVYDAKIIRRNIANLMAALPGFHCHYSIKANPNPSIIKLMLETGCGLEVASAGELDLALACGCPARAIYFAGPGKTDAEMRKAVLAGVREIHVESLDEISRLAAIAHAERLKASIALRVNPLPQISGSAQQMGGKPTAFGIDEEQVEQAVQDIKSRSSLELSGLHVFYGTQNLDPTSFAKLYRHIVGLAERISALIRAPLQTIDFGGGFGVPYFVGETPLDLEVLRHSLGDFVRKTRSNALFDNTRFVIEPGRFPTAESGIYVTRVLNTKISRGKHFAIMDGGMHHHLTASGQFGQVIKRNFPIVIGNRLEAEAERHYELAGPLCTPLDILGRSVHLPILVPGDLVAILQSGAYSRTTSPHGFLSHPSPPEVLVDAGKATLIRRRGTSEELMQGTILDSPGPQLESGP